MLFFFQQYNVYNIQGRISAAGLECGFSCYAVIHGRGTGFPQISLTPPRNYTDYQTFKRESLYPEYQSVLSHTPEEVQREHFGPALLSMYSILLASGVTYLGHPSPEPGNKTDKMCARLQSSPSQRRILSTASSLVVFSLGDAEVFSKINPQGGFLIVSLRVKLGNR